MNVSNIQYGISSFAEIIGSGSLYVDKTERIYDLITTKGSSFFYHDLVGLVKLYL